MMHSNYAAKCTFTLKLVCHDPTMAFLAELMQQDTISLHHTHRHFHIYQYRVTSNDARATN